MSEIVAPGDFYFKEKTFKKIHTDFFKKKRTKMTQLSVISCQLDMPKMVITCTIMLNVFVLGLYTVISLLAEFPVEPLALDGNFFILYQQGN